MNRLIQLVGLIFLSSAIQCQQNVLRLDPYPFVCSTCRRNTTNYTRPLSVHRLRPCDIEIVAALGDSVTSGYYALNRDADERGYSWSIGGQLSDINQLVTLPNILRQYYANLYGFSVLDGDATSAQAVYNQAVRRANSFDLFNQSRNLITRMKDATNIEFANSWKIVTVYIGTYDMCTFCTFANGTFTPQIYVNSVRDALDNLKQNLNRTLVNVVLNQNISSLFVLNDTSICRTLPNITCPCAFNQTSKAQAELYYLGINKGIEDLIKSGRYDTTDDFTVVIQPFMKNYAPFIQANGSADYSYYANDCFNYNGKGHAALAAELWNNMLQPVGRKSEKWVAYVQPNLACQTVSPYIYTNKNSDAAQVFSKNIYSIIGSLVILVLAINRF